MEREKSVETVENLGFNQESRLIGEKISNTTRYGVYCFDSPAGQVIRIMIGE
jgi:dTDP-glucose pyrophosphorylase